MQLVKKEDAMKRYILFVIAIAAAAALSCQKDDSIGGTVNSTEVMSINTFDWMSQTDETAVVAQLFEKAGLKDVINGDDVTIVGPSKWSVMRYVYRRNKAFRNGTAPEFKIEDIEPEEVAKMGMYVFPGRWDSKALKENGPQYPGDLPLPGEGIGRSRCFLERRGQCRRRIPVRKLHDVQS